MSVLPKTKEIDTQCIKILENHGQKLWENELTIVLVEMHFPQNTYEPKLSQYSYNHAQNKVIYVYPELLLPSIFGNL